MGRILKVRSGRPIPAQGMRAIFRMAKQTEAAKATKAAKKCDLAIDDLFWQGWDSYFDNTRWKPDPIIHSTDIWDGEKWDSDAYTNIFLLPIGTWAEGYRPTRCCVTLLTSGVTNIYLYCEGTSLQGGYTGIYGDGVYEFPIDNRKNDCDVYKLEVWGPVANFYVTNIEFFPGEFNIKPDITEYVENI